MRVLVIGSGAREHALVARLAADRDVGELVCAPGNPGIARIARTVACDISNPAGVLDLDLSAARTGLHLVPKLQPRLKHEAANEHPCDSDFTVTIGCLGLVRSSCKYRRRHSPGGRMLHWWGVETVLYEAGLVAH